MPLHREKLSVPVLRLETSDSFQVVTPPSISPDEPSPSFRERARALSNATSPSRRHSRGDVINATSPISPSYVLPPPPSGEGKNTPRCALFKARDESQKLLAHVLEQLRHRPKCPPPYPSSLQVASVTKAIPPRQSASRTNSEIQSFDSEHEEIHERGFSPDKAFELMNRLRDVLVISLTHGWQIFNGR